MSAKMKFLAGAAGLAALVGQQPRQRRNITRVIGLRIWHQQQSGWPVLGQVLGYGRYPYGNYGYNQYANQSTVVDQCARAVEARLGGYRGGYYGYGNVPYGGGYRNQYGYNQGYGGSRVQGITRVERKNYGLKVFGVASSGNRGYEGYGRSGYGNYGYGAGADLSFNCEVRYDGQIRDINIKRRTANWRGY